jgi:hypothetical protein
VVHCPYRYLQPSAWLNIAFCSIAWPAGFSAVKETGGTLEVRDKAGQLLRTGGTKLLGVMTVTSTGTACTSKGKNVTVVVSLPTST